MLGPIVNAVAIIICGIIGTYAIKNVAERYNEIITKAIGLSVFIIGVQGALKTENVLLLVMSMVLGSIIGEFLDIDKGMNNMGKLLEKKLGFSEGHFAKGFAAASILFCTGSMSIVGAINSGLMGNHEMLFVKSILDGTISIVFATTMGIGVAFSAIPVFIYEGGIALFASFFENALTEEMISAMSSTGSLVIAGIGFNFLFKDKIKSANMIPAMFIPCIYFAIVNLL